MLPPRKLYYTKATANRLSPFRMPPEASGRVPPSSTSQATSKRVRTSSMSHEKSKGVPPSSTAQAASKRVPPSSTSHATSKRVSPSSTSQATSKRVPPSSTSHARSKRVSPSSATPESPSHSESYHPSDHSSDEPDESDESLQSQGTPDDEADGSTVRKGRGPGKGITEWGNKVPALNKEAIWKEVKANTNAPDGYKRNCLMKVGELWRAWKSNVKKKWYKLNKDDPNILSMHPTDKRVKQTSWKELVKH